MARKIKSVPARLASLGKLFSERNAIYSNDYKHYGEVLMGMFPDGLQLNTPEEFGRMYLFIHMLSKINRYAATLKSGGHADSLDDLAVYAQMQAELDEEVK